MVTGRYLNTIVIMVVTGRQVTKNDTVVIRVVSWHLVTGCRVATGCRVGPPSAHTVDLGG